MSQERRGRMSMSLDLGRNVLDTSNDSLDPGLKKIQQNNKKNGRPMDMKTAAKAAQKLSKRG